MIRLSSDDRLLFRLFFRRFFDFGARRTRADESTLLVGLCVVLAVPGMWISALLLPRYNSPFVTPGTRLLMALDHKLQFITVAMIVGAMVAVLAWESLSLDARDAGILGVLPVRRDRLIGAKLASILAFLAMVAAAEHTLPALLFPTAMLASLPIPLLSGLTLMLAHAISCCGATVMGFFSMLLLREGLMVALPDRAVCSVSLGLRALLVLTLTAGLLMTPTISSRFAARVLSSTPAEALALPPFWFLGIYETLSAPVRQDISRLHAPRLLEGWRVADGERAVAQLASYETTYRRLALVGLLGLCLTTVLATTLFLVNARRPFLRPQGATHPRRHPGRWRWLWTWTVGRYGVGSSRASASFTWSVVTRSASHRLLLTAAAAVGCANALLLLGYGAFTSVPPATAALATQSVLLLAIVVGFRVAANVPADVEAGWIVHFARTGRRRDWSSGVRRTALLAGVVPTVVCLAVFHAGWWPPSLALAHGLVGMFVGGIAVSFLFATRPCLWLVDPGDIREGVWGPLWPVWVPAAIAAVWMLARAESVAINNPRWWLAVFGCLAMVLVVQYIAHRLVLRRTVGADYAIDQQEQEAVQRLGLSP